VSDSFGATNWLYAGYSEVVRVGNTLRCTGRIQTEHGSTFTFFDTYSTGRQAGTFLLERNVSVATAKSDDSGFATCFRLESLQPSALSNQEIFIPGVWYLDNHHVPAGALGSELANDAFLIREDRMALPLIMMRNKGNGATVLLAHCNPDGATCLADDQSGRVVDGRMQVGSLGIWSPRNPVVSFCYPAMEGERSYIRDKEGGRNAGTAKRWVERFHPCKRE